MPIKDFAVKAARPLPVIILADTSGSMGMDGKIEAMNQSLRDMVKSFGAESRLRGEIHLGVITFGGRASAHLPLTPAHQIQSIQEFVADGGTPMGAAMDIARELVEDRELIPSRAYRPILVLVSDGHPTDDWEGPFQALLASERAAKATRIGLAIGNDADEAMLTEFANDLEAPLFHADNAAEIVRFFRAVTMSVAARSHSGGDTQALKLDYRRVGDGDVDPLADFFS
jgi:uncharacterized protein YegL